MDIDLSICIVAYHNFDDILTAIRTIDTFTTKKISKKVYIVDNGYNNRLKNENEIISEITQHEYVEYIGVQENIGFGRANNLVLPKIKSKFHCIMNPDVTFSDDVFSKIIRFLEKHSEVGMVIPNMVDENGNRVPVYRNELTVLDMFIRMFLGKFFKKRQRKHTLQNRDYSKSFEVPFGQGSFLVIRTELFKEISGFDDRYFMYLEDADLCKKVNDVSKLMYFPGATVMHKWQRGSHKSLKLFKYHLKSAISYFNKWGYKWY
ncbi:glycosyltransferase [Ligilactobacillus equi]|uniref:glycosyltransferase n=1 Tax=Ligilactobacillus equi TaxID=137357 RepID=UPI002ED0858D